MNGNSFESLIKKYADELIKMSREKTLPDPPEEAPVQENTEAYNKTEEIDVLPFETEQKEEDAVRMSYHPLSPRKILHDYYQHLRKRKFSGTYY